MRHPGEAYSTHVHCTLYSVHVYIHITGFLVRRAWDSLNWRWLGLSYSAFSEDRERVMEAEEEDTGHTEEIAL